MAIFKFTRKKLFKYLTIGAASLGVISSGTFAVFMTIDATNDNFITDELREYTATFSNEGTVLVTKTYKRGETVVPPENPSHSIDGINNYIFIGWDLTGNGIPDILPTQIYYSFNAEAVYLTLGNFDLSWLDISNMDLEQLLELMEALNLDWEQFMDMFGIDLEQLMELLNKPVITFEADESQYISYFRATSFGDFNFQTKKYANPSFYDSSLIRNGSINPLSYTADKVNSAFNLVGTLPSTFSFINYDITFLAPSEYYAVPDCEHSNSTNDIVDSDAHYVKVPDDLKYQTKAAYVPAMDDIIEVLGMVPYSNNSITKDERDYRDYALKNYINVPQEYEKVIDDMIKENKWQKDDYSQVNNIAAKIEELGRCSLFNEAGDLDLNYKKNSDPVFGLIENEAGTDQDFNTVAVMVFRRLGIPARMVKGYVVPSIVKGTNTISFLNQHWWCEIYVKKIGWMICDCMNAENFLGTNPYGDLDKQNNPFEDKHNLEEIEVNPPIKTEYEVGDELDLLGAYIDAHFEDGEDEYVSMRQSGVKVEGFDSSEPGDCTVTVSYTYEGVTKTDTFTVTIKEKKDDFVSVEFNLSGVRDWYYEGEDFEKNNVIAYGVYKDGTKDPISTDDLNISGYRDEKGQYTVTITVDNDKTKDLENNLKSTTMDVEVYKKRVEDITVEPPTKVEYYVGEDFNPAGLKVTYTYYNGKTGSDDDWKMSEPDMSTPGTKTITISYTNDKDGDIITETFNISVKTNNVTSLVIDSYKNDYIVTQPFNAAEFLNSVSAHVSYEHTANKDVDSGQLYIIDYPDLSNVGTTYCKVGYTEKDIEVTATVALEVTTRGGVFNITYPQNNYDVDYDGTSHGTNGKIAYNLETPDNFPSFLQAEITFESAKPDNGADVDEHTYTPVLKIKNGGMDVTDKFGYSIGEGLAGVTYFVNPIDVDIYLSPAQSQYHVGDIVTVECVGVGLAPGDSAYFVGNVSFADVGTYSNYLDFGDIVIRNSKGEDVTDCYSFSEIYYTSVKIVD